MSQENVELVRALLEAFALRDHERAFDFYDPDIVGSYLAGPIEGGTGRLPRPRGSSDVLERVVVGVARHSSLRSKMCGAQATR